MAKKIQIIGNALVITDTITNVEALDAPIKDLYLDYKKLNVDNDIAIYDTNGVNMNASGLFRHTLTECEDNLGNSFTAASIRAFARTYLSGVSAGGVTNKGWKGEVDKYVNLPLNLITPVIGDVYLVKQPTKIGVGIFTYTTKQAGLWIKDTDTGSLSDWRRLPVKVNFTDGEFAIVGTSDESKRLKFDNSLIPTSTEIKLVAPNKNGTIALLSDIGVSKALTADPFTTFSTVVALSDLNLIIADLVAMTQTQTHVIAFANETLTSGVIDVTGAASFTGNIVLDGGGDPNAVIVIRVSTTITIATLANISLTNGMVVDNVHFIAGTTIDVAVGAIVNANLIARTTSATAASCVINGRVISLSAAITPSGNLSAPTGTSFGLDYRSLDSFVLFTGAGAITNAGASIYNGDIATNLGLLNGFGLATVNGNQYLPGVSVPPQNNYLPVETSGSVTFPNANVVYVNSALPVTITGFNAASFGDEQENRIINLGAGVVTLTKIDSRSSSANRFAIDTDINIVQFGTQGLIRVNGTTNKFLATN